MLGAKKTRKETKETSQPKDAIGVCVCFTIQSATCSNKEKIAAVCTTQSRTPPLPFWPVVMLRHRYLLMPRSHSCVHYLRGVVIFMLSSSALSYIRITNVLCYPLQTDWGVLSQYGLFWTFRELFPLPMKCHEHWQCQCSLTESTLTSLAPCATRVALKGRGLLNSVLESGL